MFILLKPSQLPKKKCPVKEFVLFIHLLVNHARRISSRSKLPFLKPSAAQSRQLTDAGHFQRGSRSNILRQAGQVPPQVEQQPSPNKVSLIKLVCSTSPLISRPPTGRMNGRGRSIRWPRMPTRCPCCKQQRPVCLFRRLHHRLANERGPLAWER